jgi:hypothetical protein
VSGNDHIWSNKKKRMMAALYAACPDAPTPLPDPALWPKTRQLADACNEDIYTARLLLLALESDGKVLCSHRSIQNSLRWYPAN